MLTAAMTEIVFADRAQSPDDAQLAATLGKAKRWWDQTLALLERDYDRLTREWKFYGAKHGWQMKVSDRKRAILYLIPRAGRFTAAFALDDHAIAAARTRGLSADLLAELDRAKTYAEGKPLRIVVETKAQLESIRLLIGAKAGP
jgi:hypothetical protein